MFCRDLACVKIHVFLGSNFDFLKFCLCKFFDNFSVCQEVAIIIEGQLRDIILFAIFASMLYVTLGSSRHLHVACNNTIDLPGLPPPFMRISC